jgi:hypothetical protein
MMGPTKLSEIRKEVRAALGMTDAELAAWFEEKSKTLRQSRADASVIESLRLFRDALVKEAKGSRPKGKKAQDRH